MTSSRSFDASTEMLPFSGMVDIVGFCLGDFGAFLLPPLAFFVPPFCDLCEEPPVCERRDEPPLFERLDAAPRLPDGESSVAAPGIGRAFHRGETKGSRVYACTAYALRGAKQSRWRVVSGSS